MTSVLASASVFIRKIVMAILNLEREAVRYESYAPGRLLLRVQSTEIF